MELDKKLLGILIGTALFFVVLGFINYQKTMVNIEKVEEFSENTSSELQETGETPETHE